MEHLQLQVEVRLFDQDEASLTEMIEILGIEDDVTRKKKMQKIKIIRKEIDSKIETDGKTASTSRTTTPSLKGTVPHLKQSDESPKKADQKVAAMVVKSDKNGTEEKPQKEQVKQGVQNILLHLAKFVRYSPIVVLEVTWKH